MGRSLRFSQAKRDALPGSGGSDPAVREERAMHIRNPVEWGVDQLRHAGTAIERAGGAARDVPAPEIRRIALTDLYEALVRGVEDFAAFRTDVAFICVIYPVVGIVL